MRINKYIAGASHLSRRSADAALATGRVHVNGNAARPGMTVTDTDVVTLDGRILTPAVSVTTLILNKPSGYVCSRDGQGSPTIYAILPAKYHQLNPVGRLDKDSSGLLLLTNDGQLAEQLTHPRYAKTKVYEITLDKPLQPLHQQMITDHGIQLEDGPSRFLITKIDTRAQRGHEREASGEAEAALEQSDDSTSKWASLSSEMEKSTTAYQITMREGRNRQIRRTFAALGYTVKTLHRTHFGPYTLTDLPSAEHRLTS